MAPAKTMRLLARNQAVLFDRLGIRRAIQKLTNTSREHLTPEINLHLITPKSHLWKSKPEECPFPDPFWAFYWAGGQALSRFILDESDRFIDSTVFDFGSGCGASSIAAVKAGAALVFSNDIDVVACEAAVLNARLNSVKFHMLNHDILGGSIPVGNVDFILIGDMFYDSSFSNMILSWLLLQKKQSRILIGDPGRHALRNAFSNRMKLLAEYPLMDHTAMETNGFKTTSVWELL